VRYSSRGHDDADVIRARLRALLAEDRQRRGWVPEDDGDAPTDQLPDQVPDWPPDDPDVDPDTSATAGATALPAGLGRHRTPGRTARLDPGRPGAWALWAVAVLAAAVVVGWSWLARPEVDQVSTAVPAAVPTTAAQPAPPPGGTPTGTDAAVPTDPAATVVVSVVGQVAAPGLVTLPAGSRVADALAAVGGLLPEADPASVNAAAVLGDGQQIAVGVPGAPPAAAGSGVPAGAGSGGLLDLNTASVAELDGLPGIGPVLAQRIVDHRTRNGPFRSIEQLDDVPGIGPAIFTALAELVAV
jgi:competence protein ComEA